MEYFFLKKKKLNNKQNIFKKNFEFFKKKYPDRVNKIGKIFPRICNCFIEKNSFYLD